MSVFFISRRDVSLVDATSGCLTVIFLYFQNGRIHGGCYTWLSYCLFSIFPEGTYPRCMLLVAVLVSVFYISRRDVSLVNATHGCLTVSFLYFQKGHIHGGCYTWLSYCHFSIFPEGMNPWRMILVAVFLSVFFISRRDVSLVDATSGCLTVIFLYFQNGRIHGGCYTWLSYCLFSIFPEGMYPWWMLLLAVFLSFLYISRRDVIVVDATSGYLTVSFLYFRKGRIPGGCY